MQTGLPIALDESAELRYLRLCLSSVWLPTALAEAGVLSGSPDFDWAALLQCAGDEGVELLWYGRVRGHDLVPRTIETELQAAYRENALRNMLLFGERDRVLRELRDDGINAVVLKGAALAENVYGDIALRPMNDIDLLVLPRDVSAVAQRLARAGYCTIPSDLDLHRLPLENEIEVALHKPGGTYYRFDIHWGLFGSPYYQHKVPSDWFWATSLPLGTAALPGRMLGPEAQVLHLTAHLMLQHRGCGLMWWQDVGEVVWTFRQRIDWNLLLNRARTYDLVLPLQQVLLTLFDFWRLPIPSAVVEQLRNLRPSPSERRVYVWRTDKRWPRLTRFWGDLLSVPDWRGRFRYAGRKLFPSASFMRERYRLRQTWQLPLAYPYHWLLGLRPTRRHD